MGTGVITRLVLQAVKFMHHDTSQIFQLKVHPNELILKDLPTKAIRDKHKDEKTPLGVTFHKCIRRGID